MNQSSLDILKSDIKDIPTKIIVGDRVLAKNICSKHMRYKHCGTRSQCNNNYKVFINNFCDWENCELVIAENCEHYVPLERYDIIVTMIYNFLN